MLWLPHSHKSSFGGACRGPLQGSKLLEGLGFNITHGEIDAVIIFETVDVCLF